MLQLSEFFLRTKYHDENGQLKRYIRKKNITSKTIKRLWYIPQHFSFFLRNFPKNHPASGHWNMML